VPGMKRSQTLRVGEAKVVYSEGSSRKPFNEIHTNIYQVQATPEVLYLVFGFNFYYKEYLKIELDPKCNFGIILLHIN